MTRPLFMAWFKTCFIPKVKTLLTRVNKPDKALFLVDNASSHPYIEEITTVPNFRIIFFATKFWTSLRPEMTEPEDSDIRFSELKKKVCLISQEDLNKIITKPSRVIDAEKNLKKLQ